jgi:hypothetical protein
MPYTNAELKGMLETELKRAMQRIDRAIEDLRKDRGQIEQELVDRARERSSKLTIRTRG